jgi:bisphosphoglycerate-independent phosphoglycerate mutase (AlkP superfamily)
MDRDKRWEREEKAYNAIRNFDAPTYAIAKEGVEASYNEANSVVSFFFTFPTFVTVHCIITTRHRCKLTNT